MSEIWPGYEREVRYRLRAHEYYLRRVEDYLQTGSAEDRERMEAAAEQLDSNVAYTINDYLLGRSVD